jgi:hypothetical protein
MEPRARQAAKGTESATPLIRLMLGYLGASRPSNPHYVSSKPMANSSIDLPVIRWGNDASNA